jgi:photosystem II stability/assembly factor-like uncharacterized protein/tetratricopeptide (TPR) repeat protein
MRPLFPCLALLAALAPTAPAAEKPFFDDATLHAVHFVEDGKGSQGWAVGDDGVIWHTLDAGKTWDRQPSGVRASLRSVHFLDASTGWVAGREELPGGGSAGVVLYTRDGGLQWRRILLNSLPGLYLVRFVDARTGYLAGDGSDQFPSGVFATTDGGRSWQPVPGPRTSSWRAGDFNAEGGALAGAWNRLATLRRAQVFLKDMDTLGGRNLRGLQLRGDDGIAVGQGGLVLVSKKSRGSTWDYAELPLPQAVREAWDFHAVHGTGPHVWAVGRPGSVALHSPDAGKSWHVVRTGQPLPLHGVFFRDENNGWAVGDLGTIVATADGGKTWQVQHRGGERLAVLCVHARPATAPLDTVARLGAEDGYLTGGLCVTGPEPASAGLSRVSEGCRFGEAFRQAGGACGEALWQFPVGTHLARADRRQLLAAWDKLHGGAAAEQFLGSLVLAVRMYRPDVILTDSPEQEPLVAEAIHEAFRQAADAKAFPAQLEPMGLSAHQAAKLYAVWAGSADAQVQFDLTELSPRLGATLREFSAGPLALLGQGQPPAQRRYHLLADNLPGAAAHRGLMQGVSLAPGSAARRELPPLEELGEAMVKAARQRANLWAIAEAPATALTNPDRLLAQIGPTLADMPQEAGARVAHGLAWQYARRGQWALAREAFLLLVERYPTSPLAIDGYRWLVLHQASSEARRRHEAGQFLIVGGMRAGVAGEKRKPLDLTPKMVEKPKSGKGRGLGEVPTFETESSQTLAYLSTSEDVRRWHQGCLALEQKLSAFGPLYANDPAVQFAVQSARRQLGDVKAALEWYRQFAANQPEGPWRKAAVTELWLANRVGQPPKPVLATKPCAQRPYLDGKLDERCWLEASVARLQNAAGDTVKGYPTEVRFSHDRDFLYVAVRCGHPEGVRVEPAKVRTRDKDLRANDRVSVMLDLDRDYGTCFHLQVDAAGCVAEDCWGDKTWDPRWFVAVRREKDAWTVEAAIPRDALTADGFTAGKAWAANVVRVLPGQGVQAFSLPAEAPEEAMRLEGMGLLMFAQDAASQAAAKEGPARR